MAKYCRYCGEKMNSPRDAFCYKCRREGKAVDRFYRKIPDQNKVSLTEDEQDILRADGFDTFWCTFILELAPLVFLGFDVYSLLAGYGGLISGVLRAVLIVIIVFLAYIGIIAFRLFMLKKSTFKHKFNIWVYKIFESWVNFRNSSRYVVHMVGTLPKRMERVELIAHLMEKLAYGEELVAAPQKERKGQREEKGGGTWKCGFCGYKNTYSSYSCKSCGKEKNKERQ